MEAINLYEIFNEMRSEFGVTGFDFTTTDTGIKLLFKGGNFGFIDMDDAAEKCEKAENIVWANIDGLSMPDVNIVIEDGRESMSIHITKI